MSETSSGTVTGRALSREMARSLAAIRREHDRLARRGRDLPPGADWLLDNWYLIEREGKLAASELRGAGRLRASGGSAVIVSACAALVRESGGAVTAERAERYLADFQRDLPFTMRELGLFAPALRLALTAEIHAAVTDGIDAAVLAKDYAAAKRFGAAQCIACGCCSYVCPAERYLTQSVRLGRKIVKERKL